MAEAREHRVLDRVRDRRLADRQAVRACLRIERPEQLLDVERDPVGSLVHGIHDLARGRESGVEDERGDERGLRPRERHQPDLLGDALRQQPGPPVAKGGAGWTLVGPIPTAEEQVPITRPAGELGDDLEAQVIGPLQVLEPEDGAAG